MISKVLIFIVGFSFFYKILDQIGLLLDFFFLFKKDRTKYGVKLIYY